MNDGAFTNVTKMMEEVGVTGPDSSRDEFNSGHIALHMPGRMSSKQLAVLSKRCGQRSQLERLV